MTDHYLLMTATPHKGDPENFCLFLALLDKDVYGNVKSLEEAMRRHHAPFYLRRDEGGAGFFPRPRDGRGEETLHEARGHARPRSSWTPTSTISTTALDPVRRGPVHQGFRATTARADARRRLHHGDAPAPLRIEHLRRAPQPRTDEGEAREHSGRPGEVPQGADRAIDFPMTSTSCPTRSRRRSSRG